MILSNIRYPIVRNVSISQITFSSGTSVVELEETKSIHCRFVLIVSCDDFISLISILLQESLGVLWVLKQLASRPNRTSHTKVYFNEFVANVLRERIGIVILTSEVMEAVRGQKHPSEAKKSMKELIYQKKYLMFLSNIKNPLAGPIRFELRPQVRKIQRPPRALYVHSVRSA